MTRLGAALVLLIVGGTGCWVPLFFFESPGFGEGGVVAPPPGPPPGGGGPTDPVDPNDPDAPDPGDNRPPTAVITTREVVTPGETVTLDGSGSSDPDGDELTFLWIQTQGETAQIANPTAATTGYLAPGAVNATSIAFQLTVRDGALSDTATVTVIVQP